MEGAARAWRLRDAGAGLVLALAVLVLVLGCLLGGREGGEHGLVTKNPWHP